MFCCLLSQLVMLLLDKSPRHETCSSISVRKAQTAVKVTIETAILKTSTPPHSLFIVYCYLLCFLLVGLIRYLILSAFIPFSIQLYTKCVKAIELIGKQAHLSQKPICSSRSYRTYIFKPGAITSLFREGSSARR